MLAYGPIEPRIDGRQSPTALMVARGTRRLLRAFGMATLCEVPLPDGRRADIVALAGNATIFIVEVKSSVADFRADAKWQEYRAHCDRLYFAIPPELPAVLLPDDAGLIVADAFGAELMREAPDHRMASATRRAMLLRFALASANRLHGLEDAEAGDGANYL